MNRRDFLHAVSLAVASADALEAQPSTSQEQRWIQTAEALKPQLHSTTKIPVSIVNPVSDTTKFLQWRMEADAPAGTLRDRLMRRHDSVILDFGEHITGHLTFAILGEGRGVDAPARLKLTFGEVPAEVAEPFDPYKGTLSRAWLQDEIINIDVLPSTIQMPRRYAFRYLKIEVIDTSPNYAVRFLEVKATALSSAAGRPPALPATASRLLQQIDAASISTLRDCMQTVFEDGPKRDRRLWIGDMRLQALTNYYTFRNFDLVKRCLYLFAGFPREDGLLPACVFEEPKPLRGHEYIIDYAALYAAAVVDYAVASGDWVTAEELWPVVRRQIEILGAYVGADGIFAAPAKAWVFIDWSERLDRTAAMHGVFVYCLQRALQLATKVGAQQESSEYAQRIRAMSQAARPAFYDPAQKLFVSGPKRQVSYATQAWLILSRIASPSEGAEALRTVMKMQDVVRPGGPYLYHYVVDAMLACGMKQEALALIQSYWGGMVKAGADTFWEVYDPSNPLLSPYGDVLVNSYCHAWSCTPAYLVRNGNLV